jgi:hypothetical protein
VLKGFNPEELPLVISGRRALGELLENEPRDRSLAPYVFIPRKRAEDIFKNDTLNKPACAVVKEMQKPTDPNAMPVEPITSLSEGHVTQVAGAYCTVREVIDALNGLAG